MGLAGIRGSGKTELSRLLARELSILSTHPNAWRVSRTLHIDLRGWQNPPMPAVRCALHYLGYESIPLSQEYRDNFESNALARLLITSSLANEEGVLLVLDNCEELLKTPHGIESLQFLASCLPRNRSAIVVTANEVIRLSESIEGFYLTGNFYIGPIDASSAARYVTAITGLSYDLASQACMLLDDEVRIIGRLKRGAFAALEHRREGDDPYTLAMEIDAAARRDLGQELAREIYSFLTSPTDRASKIEILARGFSSGTSPLIPTKFVTKELRVYLESGLIMTNPRAGYECSPSLTEAVGRAALRILTSPLEDKSLQRELDVRAAGLIGRLKETSSWPLSRILEVLASLVAPGTYCPNLLAAILERLESVTHMELLGTVEAGGSNASPALQKKAQLVAGARGCRTPYDVSSFVEKWLPNAFQSPLDLHGDYLWVIRRSFKEWDVRYPRSPEIVAARHSLIQHLFLMQGSWSQSNGAAELVAQILLDNAEAALVLGDRGIVRKEFILFDSAQLAARGWVAKQRRFLLELELFEYEATAWPKLLELRESLEAALGDERHADSLVLMLRTIRTACAIQQDRDALREYILGLMLVVRSAALPSERPALSSTAAASLRDFALRVRTPEVAAVWLRLAIEWLQPEMDLLLIIASAGDTRPIRTLARCELSLGRSLSLSGLAGEGSHVEQLALERLRFLTENYPSAASWGEYLRPVLGGSDSEFDFDDDDVHDDRLELTETAKKAVKRYRAWTRGRRVVSTSEARIEAWIMNRRWSAQGSIVRVAAATHESWRMWSAGRKIDELTRLRDERDRHLEGIVRRCGPSAEVEILKFRNHAQFARAYSVYLRRDYVNDSVLEVINEAISRMGPEPSLLLERARFYRYVWDYEKSIEEYSQLRPQFRDRVIERRVRLGLSYALIDSATYSILQPDLVKARCRLGRDLVQDLSNSHASAAMLHLRADLELNDGLADGVFDDFVDLISNSWSFASLLANDQDLFRVAALELREEGQSVHQRFIIENFTSPSLLTDLAAVLLRASEVYGHKKLRNIQAAMKCLDGARVMVRGGRTSPRHAFLEAKGLILAGTEAGTPSPLGWAHARGLENIDDLEFAHRRLSSAEAQSVGDFRRLVLQWIGQLAELR